MELREPTAPRGGHELIASFAHWEPAMRRLLLVLIASCLFSGAALALEQFSTQIQAQQHCPKDTVVWLNLPTRIWHYKGQRWYGNTKHGAYVCEKEAAASGARGTHNGE
jgi:hypothetical protein